MKSSARLVQRMALYLRTMRYLRWEQVVYRPVRRLQRHFPLPPLRPARLAEARCAAMAAVVARWGPGELDARVMRAESVVDGRFTFLNHTETLVEPDWQRRYVSHLWTYNLHYFDYALDLAWAYRATQDDRFRTRFQDLARSWMRGPHTPDGDAWESYPVSLRIVNWSYALLLLGDALEPALKDALAAEIHRQAVYLERRLELHILANHLQKNLSALVVAGLLLDGGAAERWRRRVTTQLWREMDEQVLPDGMHAERSPMYHRIALGDFLEAISLLHATGEPVPERATAHATRMVDAAALLHRADGTLHLFQDSADDGGPSLARITHLARVVLGHQSEPVDGCFALARGGYYGFVDAKHGDRFVIDCGEPGPWYQPGHAHCSLLSFELDMWGMPLVVDSGLSGYEADPLREYFRSTRAHNTVMIAGREQSEVWGTFRLGRRATVLEAAQDCAAGEYRFRGAYRPYHDRSIVHSRTVERDGCGWSVTDRVKGCDGRRVVGFLHLHPAWHVEQQGTTVVAHRAGRQVRIGVFGTSEIRIVRGRRTPAQGWYSTCFGGAEEAPVVEMINEPGDGRPFGYRVVPNSQPVGP